MSPHPPSVIGPWVEAEERTSLAGLHPSPLFWGESLRVDCPLVSSWDGTTKI